MDDNVNKTFLTEINWYDKTPLADVLRKYEGEEYFVHFSKIPKIGINPAKFHDDPYGIYFYPIDWIMGRKSNITDYERSRLEDGGQWGTDFPYVYICKINMKKHNGLFLSTMSANDVLELAEKNNFLEILATHINKDLGIYFRYEPEKYSNASIHEKFEMLLSRTDRAPAKIMLLALKYESGTKKNNWFTWTKGIDFIYDDSGIIHSIEPDQLCVINPKIIKIIERFDQLDGSNYAEKNFNKWVNWKNPLLKVLNHFVKKFNGKISKAHRSYGDDHYVPEAYFSVNDFSFSLKYSSGYNGLLLSYKKGNHTGSKTIRNKDMEALTVNQLINHLTEIIKEIMETVKEHPINNLCIEPEKLKEFVSNFLELESIPEYYEVYTNYNNNLRLDAEIIGKRKTNLGYDYMTSIVLNISDTSFSISISFDPKIPELSIRIPTAEGISIDDFSRIKREMTYDLIKKIDSELEYFVKSKYILTGKEFLKGWFITNFPIKIQNQLKNWKTYIDVYTKTNQSDKRYYVSNIKQKIKQS